ncbi:MAG TPA: MarR family winged helix-turn-helix transcriptional regulator [Jatrophihabitans sp.]|nr:MarR family winged helix-turn-helix transcriptional regulator [Jatrophihabitans sp.]
MTVSDDEGSAVRDWELLRRVVAEAHRRILARVADDSGFHEPSFGVLSALLHAPDRRLPMSRLAREAAMTTGGFTRLADRLGGAGLIDRRGSDRDRRVIYASLTPAGLREARRLERRYQAALREEVLGVLSARELRLVADTLRSLDTAHVIETESSTVRQEPVGERRRRAGDRAPTGHTHVGS